MTTMKTDSKILIMMMKQIISNYEDNNQHEQDKSDAGDTSKDVVRISKMMTSTRMMKKTSMMTANQIITLQMMTMTRTTTTITLTTTLARTTMTITDMTTMAATATITRR